MSRKSRKRRRLAAERKDKHEQPNIHDAGHVDFGTDAASVPAATLEEDEPFAGPVSFSPTLSEMDAAIPAHSLVPWGVTNNVKGHRCVTEGKCFWCGGPLFEADGSFFEKMYDTAQHSGAFAAPTCRPCIPRTVLYMGGA